MSCKKRGAGRPVRVVRELEAREVPADWRQQLGL
jgi:hypothetical protein